jgi:hypothetical protein
MAGSVRQPAAVELHRRVRAGLDGPVDRHETVTVVQVLELIE